MGGLRDLSFVERRNAAADAKRAALEKFREHAGHSVTSEGEKARTAGAADRGEPKRLNETKKAEAQAHDAQLATKGKRKARSKPAR